MHAGQHHHHSHRHDDAPRSESRLLLAAAVTTVTLAAEAVGGWISGSLALLADAGHMLVDATALALAWFGARLARRPPDARRSFGYGRMEVLAGFVNALTMFALVAWIVWEAVERIRAPAPILSGVMLAVALGGLAVNVAVLRILRGHDHHDGQAEGIDVNVQGARLHVLGDLLGSLAAVAAALIVRYTGWTIADPILSLLVALLIVASAWQLLRRSAHILLEGVPEGLDVDEVTSAIAAAHPDILDAHHVHLWQLAGGSRMATLHLHLAEHGDRRTALSAVRSVLRERYRVDHATVQIDDTSCEDENCISNTSPTLGRTDFR